MLALGRMRSYVDLAGVGVWGWNGGGSNTLILMFRSPDLFRVGVSVAPVPDQKLYKYDLSETLHGPAGCNADGYRSGSPINFAAGSGDDNVNFQGTQKLVNRLIELGKPFDFMEYPNRTNIYRLIARYIEDHQPTGPR